MRRRHKVGINVLYGNAGAHWVELKRYLGGIQTAKDTSLDLGIRQWALSNETTAYDYPTANTRYLDSTLTASHPAETGMWAEMDKK